MGTCGGKMAPMEQADPPAQDCTHKVVRGPAAEQVKQDHVLALSAREQEELRQLKEPRFTAVPRVNTPIKNPVVERKRSLETCVRYHTHDIRADYDLEEANVVGSGYSGPVLMASSKSFGHSNKRYAVKKFDKRNLCTKKLAFLKAEVNIYLKLDHPYITRLFEVYETENGLYLVMEYCSGGELYHRLQSKKIFSERCAADTTYQMLLAIGYLHNNNIVHRDLKLENWLYENEDEDAKLKLIDFGFSKVFSKHTKMHQSCGSVAYVAPEVLRRSYSAGHCDMWSLGVIVFMLLSGYPPFYGRTEEKMIILIEQGRYHMRNERWDRISDCAKDFVRKLLEMDEHKRLSAEQALRHPWIRDRMLACPRAFSPEVVQGLRQYALAPQLKRAVLCTIAMTLDATEIADLRDIFISLDKSRSGTISLVDFRDAMKQYTKEAISTEEIRRTFHCLDHDNHGCIEYSQFIAALIQSKIGLKDGFVRDAFDKFDTDHKGFLTVKNLEDVLGDKFGEAQALLGEACCRRRDMLFYDEFAHHVVSSSSPSNSSSGQLAMLDKNEQCHQGMEQANKAAGSSTSSLSTSAGGSSSGSLSAVACSSNAKQAEQRNTAFQPVPRNAAGGTTTAATSCSGATSRQMSGATVRNSKSDEEFVRTSSVRTSSSNNSGKSKTSYRLHELQMKARTATSSTGAPQANPRLAGAEQHHISIGATTTSSASLHQGPQPALHTIATAVARPAREQSVNIALPPPHHQQQQQQLVERQKYGTKLGGGTAVAASTRVKQRSTCLGEEALSSRTSSTRSTMSEDHSATASMRRAL
ncbi:unnamed protein product [Amoebophrya sp. A25]|nr:unnamed protein product [Amoebophrya sp. A25]|eukprot:GSA25T00005797001.1